MVATNDEKNNPVTCVIDIMLYDEKGLYFLTAKGKSFYERLKKNENLSLTGLKGSDTMTSKSITIKGRAEEVEEDYLEKIFEKNIYMKDIYPNNESRKALRVFRIYEGEGEFFDLSSSPIFRKSFSFGKELTRISRYTITTKCILCGKCINICPQSCIEKKDKKAFIKENNCLHCGSCFNVCPVGAVLKEN